jgi:formylglycine-generating enzyme required for sulfatase activity
MVLVDGRYCPAVVHECLEWHPAYLKEQKRLEGLRARGEPVGRSNVAARCLRFREPSTCATERRPLRFCMDRYEWPNVAGKLPQVLTSWTQARDTCRGVGKRLCNEHEFNFACEGEQVLPYTYGFRRDATRCAIDRPYIRGSTRFMHYDACLADDECRAALAEVDQRVPIGAMPRCVSPFGVHDLNGNVDEWVLRIGEEAPSRSGLKGGWWGPLRNRCRPITTFHLESDYGYGIGFRCCRDATAAEGSSE